MARVCESSHGTRQARCTGRRGGEAIMGGEYANSIHQFRLEHGNGPSAVTPEHRNGGRTRLAAGEHLRGCSKIAYHPNRATGRERGRKTRGGFRLDRHDASRRCQPAPEALGDGSGESADTSLYKDVCRTPMAGEVYLIADFRRRDAVSRHDVANDGVVRIVGRVGDKNAGALAGRGCGRINCIVVGARHPHDLGTLVLDAARARVRHALVQEHAGGAPRQSARRQLPRARDYRHWRRPGSAAP